MTTFTTSFPHSDLCVIIAGVHDYCSDLGKFCPTGRPKTFTWPGKSFFPFNALIVSSLGSNPCLQAGRGFSRFFVHRLSP
jgi:hypothetical protein